MAEKIYPASKAAVVPATVTASNPSFPPNKARLYNATRPLYRPQPRRSCCCAYRLWVPFALLLHIIIAAITCGIVYVIYRPQRPSFTVSSLQISQFNLTSSNQLTTKFNFTVTARNPNKRIVFLYDRVSISINSNGVEVGDGEIPAFVMPKNNTTKLRAIASTKGQIVDDNSSLKSDLKNKKSLPLKIQLDTKVKVKIGGFKTKKGPVRVVCKGIKAAAPTGKWATAATTSGAKCKVDLLIKIWKWTIFD